MASKKMISLPGFQQRAASAVLLGWESGGVHVGVGCRVKGALFALLPGRAQLSAQEVGVPALIYDHGVTAPVSVCVCGVRGGGLL